MVIDYYSNYDVNTFLLIANLHQRIPKLYVNVDLLNAAVFWFTNAERRKYNLKQFQFHSKLRQMANWHSEQMKVYNFFNHDNDFNTRYRTLTDRISSVMDNNFRGFMCYGENISDYPVIKTNEYFTVKHINGIPRLFSSANGREIFSYSYFELARIVVESWMNSPGHRKNILNPDFTFLGCGSAKYEKQGKGYSMTYFKLTQNFGGGLVANNFFYDIQNKINKFIRT